MKLEILLICVVVVCSTISLKCEAKPTGEVPDCACSLPWWMYPEQNCCKNEDYMAKIYEETHCDIIHINCDTVTDYNHSVCCPDPNEKAKDSICMVDNSC